VGQIVGLQPLVFDLLAMLVRNHARVVSKDELLEAEPGRLHSSETPTALWRRSTSSTGEWNKRGFGQVMSWPFDHSRRS
jgi:hypothetical protein